MKMKHPTPDISRAKVLVECVRRMLGGRSLHQRDPHTLDQLTAPLQARLDTIEQRLADLSRQMQAASGAQNGHAVDQVHTRLETITHHLEDVSRQIAATGATRNGGESETVRDAIAALEKQISRAGREQLKANSLTESQTEKLSAALETLRADNARRDTELATVREQMHAAEAAARQDVIQAIFPALDGLDEAIRSGEQLLEQPEAAPSSATFFERMWMRKEPPLEDTATTLRAGMSAWLVGLTFVRQRLLDVLAAEGVQPISAAGEPFDPEVHIAMDVVPASAELPPGIVATELRRGYRSGNRVLRHAEVAVSSERTEPSVGDAQM